MIKPEMPEPLTTYLDDMGRPTDDKSKAVFVSEETPAGITIKPFKGVDTSEDT